MQISIAFTFHKELYGRSQLGGGLGGLFAVELLDLGHVLLAAHEDRHTLVDVLRHNVEHSLQTQP